MDAARASEYDHCRRCIGHVNPRHARVVRLLLLCICVYIQWPPCIHDLSCLYCRGGDGFVVALVEKVIVFYGSSFFGHFIISLRMTTTARVV
jgi:hypothetical protein